MPKKPGLIIKYFHGFGFPGISTYGKNPAEPGKEPKNPYFYGYGQCPNTCKFALFLVL